MNRHVEREPMMQVNEVAAILMVSRPTVIKMIREGKLTAVQYGKAAWRILPASLDLWIQEAAQGRPIEQLRRMPPPEADTPAFSGQEDSANEQQTEP